MLERRLKITVLGWAFASLALPLLLTQCTTTTDDDTGDQPSAGASGSQAQSGAAGTLGGANTAGGAPASEGGAAGDSASAGLGGRSAAGAGAGDAGAGGSAGLSDECASELASFSAPSALHVAVCSALEYPMNPPVYGDHYPVWAAYKSYSFPVPLGFLVHNLEHGAVVILYNCPEGCSAEVAAVQAFIDALPDDPRCGADVKHQVVMSPDPSLPKRWAAVAWGRSLTADCFVPATFGAFYAANVGRGPEDICGNGADLTADTCQ